MIIYETVEAPLTKATTLPQAALVVFGQTSKGAHHAAWFPASDSANVHKAAPLQSLHVLEPIPADLTSVLAKVAKGKFVVGQISLTKVAPETFTALQSRLEAAAQGRPAGDAADATTETSKVADGAAAPAKPLTEDRPLVSRPGADAWLALKAGDIVLAPYGTSEDGWWEARVLGIDGDICRLMWCDGSATLKLYRFQIGCSTQNPHSCEAVRDPRPSSPAR